MNLAEAVNIGSRTEACSQTIDTSYAYGSLFESQELACRFQQQTLKGAIKRSTLVCKYSS
jgi:hypothetical protein